MKLYVFATKKGGSLFRIGQLQAPRQSYQIKLIDFATGSLSNDTLGVGKSTAGCKQIYQSFHWTYRCTGCGNFIRGNRKQALRLIPDFVPFEEKECHYWPCERDKVPGVLPSNIPGQLAKYFDGICWAGEPCSLDEPRDCRWRPPHSHRLIYPSCRDSRCSKMIADRKSMD